MSEFILYELYHNKTKFKKEKQTRRLRPPSLVWVPQKQSCLGREPQAARWGFRAGTPKGMLTGRVVLWAVQLPTARREFWETQVWTSELYLPGRDGKLRRDGGRHIASGPDLKLLLPVLGCWESGAETQGEGPLPVSGLHPASGSNYQQDPARPTGCLVGSDRAG